MGTILGGGGTDGRVPFTETTKKNERWRQARLKGRTRLVVVRGQKCQRPAGRAQANERNQMWRRTLQNVADMSFLSVGRSVIPDTDASNSCERSLLLVFFHYSTCSCICLFQNWKAIGSDTMGTLDAHEPTDRI